MSKIYIDKNDIVSTMLENFDSANRRTLNVGGVFQTFLNVRTIRTNQPPRWGQLTKSSLARAATELKRKLRRNFQMSLKWNFGLDSLRLACSAHGVQALLRPPDKEIHRLIRVGSLTSNRCAGLNGFRRMAAAAEVPLRGRVGHPFRVVKRKFGYTKVR